MGPLFEDFGGSYHVGVETGIELGLFLASGVITDVPAGQPCWSEKLRGEACIK